jgi:hypothetical protein
VIATEKVGGWASDWPSNGAPAADIACLLVVPRETIKTSVSGTVDDLNGP